MASNSKEQYFYTNPQKNKIVVLNVTTRESLGLTIVNTIERKNGPKMLPGHIANLDQDKAWPFYQLREGTVTRLSLREDSQLGLVLTLHESMTFDAFEKRHINYEDLEILAVTENSSASEGTLSARKAIRGFLGGADNPATPVPDSEFADLRAVLLEYTRSPLPRTPADKKKVTDAYKDFLDLYAATPKPTTHTLISGETEKLVAFLMEIDVPVINELNSDDEFAEKVALLKELEQEIKREKQNKLEFNDEDDLVGLNIESTVVSTPATTQKASSSFGESDAKDDLDHEADSDDEAQNVDYSTHSSGYYDALDNEFVCGGIFADKTPPRQRLEIESASNEFMVLRSRVSSGASRAAFIQPSDNEYKGQRLDLSEEGDDNTDSDSAEQRRRVQFRDNSIPTTPQTSAAVRNDGYDSNTQSNLGSSGLPHLQQSAVPPRPPVSSSFLFLCAFQEQPTNQKGATIFLLGFALLVAALALVIAAPSAGVVTAVLGGTGAVMTAVGGAMMFFGSPKNTAQNEAVPTPTFSPR